LFTFSNLEGVGKNIAVPSSGKRRLLSVSFRKAGREGGAWQRTKHTESGSGKQGNDAATLISGRGYASGKKPFKGEVP